MRCLVTGAYGFIGREVVAALQGEALQSAPTAILISRPASSRTSNGVACDFNRDVEVSLRVPRLKDIDAVVNCVGVLGRNSREFAVSP
jgi:nucleoside-diphosphate-sugar epimerase